MKFSATAILLATAIGVSAHPSGHAHRNAHRALEARTDFVIAKKPAPPPPAPKPSPPPAPKPSVVAAPVKPNPIPTNNPTPSSSPGSGSGGSGYKPFCGGKSKRASLADIAFKGNVGTAGNYGCNLMIVDEDVADKYDYVTTFVNNAGSAQKGACWLKIGPDNGINGFFTGNQAVNFDLPAGGKVVLAAEGNSQGACSFGQGSVPLTSIGQFAGTWYEFDFANERNKKWSGADASSLVAAAAGLSIPALKVCDSKTCSTIYKGGKGDNAFLGGMEALDGIGLNLGPGPVSLTVTVG